MPMRKSPTMTTSSGAPVADNQNSLTAGPFGPVLMQDFYLLEKLAHQNRERIPERTVHAKGSAAYGTLTVTNDITKYTTAPSLSQVGKKTDAFLRVSTLAAAPGAPHAPPALLPWKYVPGQYPDAGPRHPGELPPHTWLRLAHLLLHQRGRRAVLGQISLQVHAGDQELDQWGSGSENSPGPRDPWARPL